MHFNPRQFHLQFISGADTPIPMQSVDGPREGMNACETSPTIIDVHEEMTSQYKKIKEYPVNFLRLEQRMTAFTCIFPLWHRYDWLH